MRLIIATLHVRQSAQAVALAAGCLKSSLPAEFSQQTTLVDLFIEQDDKEILAQLRQHKPTHIAFSLYTWNRTHALRLCRQLKQQDPELFLIAGGPEASADSAAVLREGQLDCVIRGEGEHALAQLLEAQRQPSDQPPLSDITGLVLPQSQTAQHPATCPDLSQLPSPWLNADLPLQPGCGVLWEVARGCHFACAFCFDAKGLQGVRPFPLERLKKELELFVERGVSQVWVLDSTFNAPPGRGRKLLQTLLETAPELHYHIEAKADLLDDETINLLSQLFCSVQVGLQSSDPDILSRLNRQLKPQQMQSQLKKLSVAGVTFGLDLIYGLPADNHRGFRNSLDFALATQPNQIDIFPLAVLPGTELYLKKTEHGIEGEPQPPYLIRHNDSYSPEDMAKSRLLAAAAEIFYNRGRAVGFMLQLCQALSWSPTDLLDAFALWMTRDQNIPEPTLYNDDHWVPSTILALQLEFVATALKSKKRKRLIAAAQDLIYYHYCCAETLLAEDCQLQQQIGMEQILKSRWQLNPAIQLAPFNVSIEGLEMLGGEPLQTIVTQLAQEPGHAIFLRQQGELVIEELDEGFALLLNRARKPQSGKDLSRGMDRNVATELLEFAVGQGLLLPPG